MTPTASVVLPLAVEQDDVLARPDLSCATGIMAGVAMSAVFWTVIGYAVNVLLG